MERYFSENLASSLWPAIVISETKHNLLNEVLRMSNVFLVEHNTYHEAFTRREGAQARLLELVREGIENSGITPEEIWLDFESLAGYNSTPANWEELSLQWNEFWVDEPDMWFLLYEIPLFH